MSEAKKGIDQILLFRILNEKNAATKLMFQTEHGFDRSLEGGDSTMTKDGAITSPGTPTEEWPFSSIIARDDAVYTLLLQAYREQKTIEVWSIDKGAEPATIGEAPNQIAKYPATYAQGKITELSETANAEDLMELSGTIKIDGVPQSGEATLTAEQADVIQYEFKDTTRID